MMEEIEKKEEVPPQPVQEESKATPSTGGETTSPTPVGQRGRKLRLILTITLFLIVLTHATQDALKISPSWGGEGKATAINLTVADVLIAGAFVLWIVTLFLERKNEPEKKGVHWLLEPARLVPLPVLCLVLWMILSVIPILKGATAREWMAENRLVINRAAALKDLLQFILYFGVGYVLFVANLKGRRLISALALALSVVTTAVVAYAWYQYLRVGEISVMEVSARFGNRNVLGGYLALALPALWGMALWTGNWPCRIWLILVVLGGLGVTLAGGAFLAICLALLALAYWRNRVVFVALAVVLAVWCTVGMNYLPRRNSDILLDSVLLYKNEDPYHTLKEEILKKVQREVASKKERLKWSATALATAWEKWVALSEKVRRNEPVDSTSNLLADTKADPPPNLQENLLKEEDFSWQWQQRYKEWQVGLQMMRVSPLFGVGVGNHRANFARFYSPIPKYEEDLMEPDAHNFYMVFGAELGAPALLVLLWLLLDFVRKGVKLHLESESALLRGLGAGVIGSILAFAVNSLFTNMWVRGVGVTMVILLALVEGGGRLRSSAETPGDTGEDRKSVSCEGVPSDNAM